MKIALIGNGILANLGALYYSKIFPQAEIFIIGPSDRSGLPVVGESFIEITSLFLEKHLGLATYLMKNHLPKYSLTYYFKLKIDDPADRTYSVHCAERGLNDVKPIPGWEGPMARPATWLVNREVFDRDIQKMTDETSGITRIKGSVTDFDLNSGKEHRLHIEEENGNVRDVLVDWAIDCTGRNQIFARKMNLVVKPEGQRDCFWFRCEGFDRNILKQINALGPMPPAEGDSFHYDRYYSTHHFLGRGFWIWMIPMKSETPGKDLISIGFTSHPDYCPADVRDMDSFLKYVESVHPVVTDLVKSGTIVDTNLLKRYHYVTSQVYSEDRWAIVGDAAFAPDPLFSNGLAFGTIQLEQIGEMIRRDSEGTFNRELVDTLSKVFAGPVIASQTTISNWYATMHDPLLNSLRLTTIEIAFFHVLLPLVINQCHYATDKTVYWAPLQLAPSDSAFEISRVLLNARKEAGEVKPEHFTYYGKKKVNPDAMRVVSDPKQLKEQMMKGVALLDEFTKEVLAKLKPEPAKV